MTSNKNVDNSGLVQPTMTTIDFFNNSVKFPLAPNSKAPRRGIAWKDLAKTIKSNDGENTAFLCGKINGITVVDVDDIDLFPFHDICKDTFTVKTIKGLHYYFKYNPLMQIKIGLLKCFDIKNDNSYVVCPPSQISGKKYEIINNVPIKPIPQKLLQCISETNSFKLPKHDQPLIQGLTYEVPYDVIRQVVFGLPQQFCDNFISWLNITSVLKQYHCQDLWIKWSKQSKKFDDAKNKIFWETSKPIIGINYLIKIYNKYHPDSKLQCIKPINDDFLNFKYPKDINVINLEQQYLPPIQPDFEMLCIKSAPGSGKTTCIGQYIKDKNYLCITSRISLAKQLHENFKDFIENKRDQTSLFYKDCIFYNNRNPLIVQLDSLHRFFDQSKDEVEVNYICQPGCGHLKCNIKDKVVIIDEIDSFIKHWLFSKTLKQSRTEIYRMMNFIIKECKQIIVADADFNPKTIDFLRQFDRKITIINNKEQPTNKVAYFHKSLHTIFSKILENINAGGKPWICADRKSTCRQIRAWLQMKGVKEQDMLLITQKDGPALPTNKDFQNKIVIISPKIVYGVDFSSLNKESTFSISMGRTMDTNAICQQMYRNRNCKDIHIYTFESDMFLKWNSKPNYIKYVESDINKFINELQEYRLVSTDDNLKDYLNVRNPMYNVYFNYRWEDINLRSNNEYYIKKILEKRGFIIDETNKTINKKLNKQLKDELEKCKELILEKDENDYKICVEAPKIENAKVDENFGRSVEKFWSDYQLTKEEKEIYKDIFIDEDKNRLLQFIETDLSTDKMNYNEMLINNVSGNSGKILLKHTIETILGCTVLDYQDLDIVKLNEQKYNIKNCAAAYSHLYGSVKKFDNNKLSLLKIYKNIIEKEYSCIIHKKLEKRDEKRSKIMIFIINPDEYLKFKTLALKFNRPI